MPGRKKITVQIGMYYVREKLKRIIFNRLFRDETLRLRVSFGDQLRSNERTNDSEIYYIIRRESQGHGFFSNFMHVLMNVAIADFYGWIPVVDQETRFTLYHSDRYKEHNIWYKYFEGDWSIKSLLESSGKIIFSDEKFPHQIYTKFIDNTSYLEDLVGKYICPRPEFTREAADFFLSSQVIGSEVLGVHWRGTDMNKVGRQQASLSELRFHVDQALDTGLVKKVFLCADEERNIADFVDVYGDTVIFTDCYRSSNKLPIHVNQDARVREDHAFLCGKEVLLDALILSSCKKIVGKNSNVLNSARIFGGINSDRVVKLKE